MTTVNDARQKLREAQEAETRARWALDDANAADQRSADDERDHKKEREDKRREWVETGRSIAGNVAHAAAGVFIGWALGKWGRR